MSDVSASVFQHIKDFAECYECQSSDSDISLRGACQLISHYLYRRWDTA